jgi:K+ potassium transporter
MLVWFVVIGLLGIVGIVRSPAVLAALSPMPAIIYLWHGGPLAFAVIGAAFLAVTGGESKCGSFAMFAAIRRASSRVSRLSLLAYTVLVRGFSARRFSSSSNFASAGRTISSSNTSISRSTEE